MKVVAIGRKPHCDFCRERGISNSAGIGQNIVDGPTIFGPHAYMCDSHFAMFGIAGSSINVRIVEYGTDSMGNEYTAPTS